MRLKLKEGQWVDFKDSLTHAEGRHLAAAMMATQPVIGLPANSAAALAQQQAVGEAEVRVLETFAQVYVTGWNLKNNVGPLTFEAWPVGTEMPESWQHLDERIFTAVARKAQTIWRRERNSPLVESDEESDSDSPT